MTAYVFDAPHKGEQQALTNLHVSQSEAARSFGQGREVFCSSNRYELTSMA
jgi:hypothetical protein